MVIRVLLHTYVIIATFQSSHWPHHRRIARISRLIQDGTLDITVHNRAVLPSATDVHAQIRQLQPAMIDWSNIVDYMHPRDFHRMARACSAQQAPSPPGSPDTPSPTTIHRAHSIGWVCRTYGASILDYPIETRYELYHAQFRPRLTELQRNIYQGRVLAAPCQSPMEIAEYCMGSVYAPRWTRHFMRLARVKGKGCDADGVNANGVDDVSGNDVSGNGDATTATIARSRSVVYADTDPLFMRSPSTFHFGFNYGDVPMER